MLEFNCIIHAFSLSKFSYMHLGKKEKEIAFTEFKFAAKRIWTLCWTRYGEKNIFPQSQFPSASCSLILLMHCVCDLGFKYMFLYIVPNMPKYFILYWNRESTFFFFHSRRKMVILGILRDNISVSNLTTLKASSRVILNYIFTLASDWRT